MNLLSSRSLSSFMLVLLGTLAVPRAGSAQVQWASSVVDKDLGCIAFVGCGTIGTPLNAVDTDAATAATISPTAAVSSSALRVGFATTVPVGARVKMLIGFSGGGLNLGLLGQTSIRTFATMGGPALQDFPLNNLVNVSVLTSSAMLVEFPATVAFKQLELRTGGALNVLVGSYSVSLYQATATVTPLPVELVSFVGKARAAAVDLNWQTASERNSAYFLVERSVGAQEGFRLVGRVAAAGTSTKPAAYRFSAAAPAGLSYYRLRQVDQDGTSTYSPVVAVTAAAAALQAYPNPATDVVTVTGPAGMGFTVFNRLGQAVQKGEIPLTQQSEVDMRELPDGVYVLREQATGTAVRIAKAAGNLAY